MVNGIIARVLTLKPVKLMRLPLLVLTPLI